MLIDKSKEMFARAVAGAFASAFPQKHAEVGPNEVFSYEYVLDSIERPKDPRMGRFAFPVFRASKMLGAKPDAIAAKIAEIANSELERMNSRRILSVEPVAGFVNARVNFDLEAHETLRAVLDLGTAYGSSETGKDHTVLVEYCSANIAKPFGIGHLRTTILGNSLRRVFHKMGYDAVGINYLGDWGTQFGKMIVAYQKWGRGGSEQEESVYDLVDLYVRYHREAETDKSLDDQAREAFRKLEDGDPETHRLWERFKDISLAEFKRVFDLMGIEFDWITGEAFLNDKIEPVIERIRAAGLTTVSDGALIVDLNDPQLPPCLLRKADGATLYATRDIVGLLYRWEKYHFDEALYVVASAQSDHFKQVFRVVEMLEEAEKTPPDQRIAHRARHVDFGWVKFGDKAMSTRRGNVVVLEDVINKAVELARQKIREKNPELKEIDKTALMIGVGAVLFSQLSVRRQKDVSFDWDEVLNFEGETGPYLQYTHARLCSLIRNYRSPIAADIDVGLLNKEEEQRVIEALADFPQSIRDAARNYEPNHVSTHLIRTAGAFNKVYQRKLDDGKIDKIISDDAALSAARMAMVKAVQVVLREGLYLLGIEAPDEM
ncbi:MAG: arginine--tRNA ligase [Candidatus Zixiibacteriota bacterium]|nr:MAG: arginine--tRNA ligase [candidate division Zixibacteria bacterium]